jgi:uncharacterized protein (TIGR01319 family)
MKKAINLDTLTSVLVTDCGSTTTKALLFEKVPGKGWRYTFRGESPTTVEQPVADVTVGVRNAFLEVEELCGRLLLKSTVSGEHDYPLIEKTLLEGVDLYLSTSSAGGGLQMVVTGVVGSISAESAERAALGAGAIVMERLSTDSNREDYETIARLRHLKPDIILIAGGYEGGASHAVIELCEIIRAASPSPRFGTTLHLPIVYCGNSDVVEEVSEILKQCATVVVVQNVRPSASIETMEEARDAIHELFLTHVMSHSPGYANLLEWSPAPIMPTPAAVGDMVQAFAKQKEKQVLCVDIGGATTDVFSVCRNLEDVFVFNRTVSANLGMSYSVSNVLVEAGVDNIARWLPFKISKNDVRDVLRNKMIRPTSIPQTMEELWLEQAVCREALRLSLEHHKSFAVGVYSGGAGGISSVFKQKARRYELLNQLTLDVVIGSGGVLSHAPVRLAAALMMIEGFGLAGVTELCVDSVFMMPHLGVFSSVHPEAALEIFQHDCIVPIAASVVPVFPATLKEKELADIYIAGTHVSSCMMGQVILVPALANAEKEISIEVRPLHRSINVGAGPGVSVKRTINMGQEGLIIDGRGCPIRPAYFTPEKHSKVYTALGLMK